MCREPIHVYNTRVDSKMDENSCKQKCELIQVMGNLYRYMYNQYKTECKFEPYLDLVCENKYKIALSRFRLSSHSLMIEIGRYNGTPREDRLCTFCNMRKNGRISFLLVCPYYTELRRRYFKNYFCSWLTLTKFDHLMSATSKKTLNN